MARRACLLVLVAIALLVPAGAATAQTPPSMTDSNLDVRTAASGLTGPTSFAFLGANDMLVLEKPTGRVKHVVNGEDAGTALDLAVNSASERGLLGIALHPNFAQNHWVYLFWTCQTTAARPDNFTPAARNCDDTQMLGADTNVTLAVPLLGNRIDRFVWDPETETLSFEKHIISLLSFQADGAPTPPNQGDSAQNSAGNQQGGVLRFGRDGRLYAIVGDIGRRGQMQNLLCGPTATSCRGSFLRPIGATLDDQFGGPQPDDAHLSSVILRLDDDGDAPASNPFFDLGEGMGGTAGANLQKVFALGIRNSFGMAVDPVTGALWEQENGDDSFDEINRVSAGMNSGFVQIMGPASRLAQYRDIETTFGGRSLQQLRWPPTNIAETQSRALDRVRAALPPASYSDPEFSWRWNLPPGAIGFVDGNGLGTNYNGNLFVGGATQGTVGGHLFRFRLNSQRTGFAFQDSRLNDRVADNLAKADITESESLLAGSNFGIVTDIQTGPNGHLYVVSTNRGVIYEVFPAG